MERIDELRLKLEKYSDRTPKDELLCQLILNICSLSRDSPQRRRLMNRLLQQLQRLPKLLKSSHLFYYEAVNKTWEWLDNNLHNFDPRLSPIQDSLLIWINCHLKYRIYDLYAKKNQNIFPLDLEFLERSGFYNDCLDAQIEQIERQEKQALAREIAKYFDRDPEQKLRRCHPQNRPDCNCQFIVQRLFFQPSPEKMATIARQLNINTQTIRSFWKRKGLSKVQAIARQIAQKNSDVMSG
ncbi:MAG: hypothetical protein QQW96_04270 [Tychonema bourrellyi B0820]|uniref:Sigma-70 family RNA polymerase sigma factor n=1 Tax=Tychonema bourrellyi FEM_GT703 TaxID=2040638 RepID=A0A2G4F3Q7_9CYAN|nr:hypothetical protein [Tychonema bourrellyi]MDQ2096845.1 hypothetical protein [Tychonema bourrellyi B0820]PHX56392.1 hypothetical protein CP500_005615 [Tychonema bourrellyi FEM_GT703]